jgi:hypothetical protein
MTRNRFAHTMMLVMALATIATSATPAADVWVEKIREYTNNKFVLMPIKKTPDVVLVYLCRPNAGAFWAYKFTDDTLRDARLLLRGYAVYNTSDRRSQHHGQGVFFLAEGGPMFERAKIPDERVQPSGFADMTIVARNKDNQEVAFPLGRISAQTAKELSETCLSSSFPRVLHKCVPVGHAAPCRPAP